MPRFQFSKHASRQAAAAAIALVTLLAAGCSKTETDRVPVFPVTGQVTFDGRPAAGAFVVFHRKDNTVGFPPPRAQVDQQGNFAVSTYVSQDGAPVGEYVVTVELRKVVDKDGEFVPGPNVLPPKYSSPKTTSLVAKINEGENSLPIKIVR